MLALLLPEIELRTCSGSWPSWTKSILVIAGTAPDPNQFQLQHHPRLLKLLTQPALFKHRPDP
jgi:hypothetical protein